MLQVHSSQSLHTLLVDGQGQLYGFGWNSANQTGVVSRLLRGLLFALCSLVAGCLALGDLGGRRRVGAQGSGGRDGQRL